MHESPLNTPYNYDTLSSSTAIKKKLMKNEIKKERERNIFINNLIQTV